MFGVDCAKDDESTNTTNTAADNKNHHVQLSNIFSVTVTTCPLSNVCLLVRLGLIFPDAGKRDKMFLRDPFFRNYLNFFLNKSLRNQSSAL